MPIIETKIKSDSRDFAKNDAANRKLADDLKPQASGATGHYGAAPGGVHLAISRPRSLIIWRSSAALLPLVVR